MSAIYKNGIAYGGAASAANLISATDAEGAATNVQAQLDTINENITSLNDDLTNNYAPISSDRMTTLEPNTDFNDLLTPGLYRAGPDADIPTYINCPTAITFTMYIFQRNIERPIQVVISNEADVFVRCRKSPITWTAWTPSPRNLTDLVKQQEINATLPANANHVTVTATIPSGYKWLAWTNVATSGWTGYLYPLSSTSSSQFWISGATASTNRSFIARYLVIRDI